MDVTRILNVVQNAIAAIQTAKRVIDEFDNSGVVLNSTSQDEVDDAIKALETEYEGLHSRVQDKLRGTGG